MADTKRCIEVCNRLLRGEISATETYEQALDKFQGDPEEALLQKIRDDHEESVATLEDHLVSMGAEPDTESGVWGGFAAALEGAAKLLGESPALKILQTGEEHGLRDYQDALEDPGVMEDIKASIRSELIPRLREHITSLEALPAA